MILYVVHGTIGGFAREDVPVSTIIGVYTDEAVAKKVRSAASCGARIEPVTLDKIHAGHLDFINKFLGGI